MFQLLVIDEPCLFFVYQAEQVEELSFAEFSTYLQKLMLV